MAGMAVTTIILVACIVFLPYAYAEPSVAIKMEKTTYGYCEKLAYTIIVSEVTGDAAIIHIRDEAGKKSSAIPIQITDIQNYIPSPFAFKEEIFSLGKYFIDLEYAGAKITAEFELVDSNKVCISDIIKPILTRWLDGQISDGFLISAFQKYVDAEIINIPLEINEDNIYTIEIPEWLKNVAYWWITGMVSDDEFAKVINHLVEVKIIGESADAVIEI